MKIVFLGICLIAGCAVTAVGQNAQQEKQVVKLTGGQPVPQRVLYHQFFRHLNFLDRESTKLSAGKKSEDAKQLSGYYQNQLHFTSAQFAFVRATARATEDEISRLDGQAAVIIKQFRSELQNSGRTSQDTLPPIPEELRELQHRRDTAIENQTAALNKLLGAKDAAALNSYLRTKFAPHITVSRVADPRRVHDPATHPAAPFVPLLAGDPK